MPTQFTQLNPITGALTGGYTTPYTVSFPVRDRSARGGLYLFTNEDDGHFMYTPPPWSTGPGRAYALFQYVDFMAGTAMPLGGIGFPFSGNMTPPANTPLILLQNYSSTAAWSGIFATDASGNFYLPAAGNHLQVCHADGSTTSYTWTLHGTLLQIIWSASGHLYTVERAVQGSGGSMTFKDAIYKYTTSGHAVGQWYNQSSNLPQPAVPNIPTVPGVLFDVSSNGNIYGLDSSTMTVFGRAGSAYAVLFNTPLPGDAPPPRAVCVCEALGLLAVLCCAPGATVSLSALGNDDGVSVWDTQPPYADCRLYLYSLTTGAQFTPSWGTSLPLLPNACPEYNGLLFDGDTTLLVVDKFNGLPAGGCGQLCCILDPYGLLHVVYINAGNVTYAHASPKDGAWSAPVTIGAGSDPSIIWCGSRLRVAFLDDGGNYVARYSVDRGGTWGTEG